MNFISKLFSKQSVNTTVTSPLKIDSSNIERIETPAGTITKVTSPGLKDGFPKSVEILESGVIYDLQTVNGISDIQDSLNQTVAIDGYECQIEYYLQRIATDYKKQNKTELAIACLKKSNNIMSLRTDYYKKDTFLRLPEYLKQIQNFGDARIEEKRIEELFSQKTPGILSAQRAIELAKQPDINLVHIVRERRICENCAKYHDRIYAVNERDSRFPNYDIFLDYITKRTCQCYISSFPFSYGISIMTGLGEDNPVEYSNRPFEDDRSAQEKLAYDENLKTELEDKKNHADYDWIRENLSELAPKSINGYTRMKNSNSDNFKRLKLKASEMGYTI